VSYEKKLINLSSNWRKKKKYFCFIFISFCKFKNWPRRWKCL